MSVGPASTLRSKRKRQKERKSETQKRRCSSVSARARLGGAHLALYEGREVGRLLRDGEQRDARRRLDGLHVPRENLPHARSSTRPGGSGRAGVYRKGHMRS
jgi:hypothetical protein